MFKRPYVLAIVSFLMIPAVTVLAGMLINSIDPEIAVRTSNYERNFWLLTLAKNLSMLAVLLVAMGLSVTVSAVSVRLCLFDICAPPSLPKTHAKASPCYSHNQITKA